MDDRGGNADPLTPRHEISGEWAAVTLHGSVSLGGKGNDLDLIAVPMELAVTPPEDMERILCDVLGAAPLRVEPRGGYSELGLGRASCQTAIKSTLNIGAPLLLTSRH